MAAASSDTRPRRLPDGGEPAAPPLVTVIIATYNWSSVLPFAVGSALGQTFRNLEVLVVGDGCTDDSEAVVTAIDDPRLRWINLPENTGHQSGPNNEGLRQARGQLIAYLGHDDLWLVRDRDGAGDGYSHRDSDHTRCNTPEADGGGVHSLHKFSSVSLASVRPSVGVQWELRGAVARRDQSHALGFFRNPAP